MAVNRAFRIEWIAGSSDPAIHSGERTHLRQQLLALQAENAFLRQQIAAQNERIQELVSLQP